MRYQYFSLFFLTIFLLTNIALAQWSYVVPPDSYYGANYLISHNSDLYLATNKDVFKSTDDGSSWNNLSNGFITDAGNANHYIQFAGNNIFVGSTLYGVFVSPDNGASWQMDTTGLDPGWSTQVDVLYSDGTKIFASRAYSTYGFYTKDAAPGPWTRVNSNSIGTGYATQVLGMTKVGDNYYAATQSSGVFESSDGLTWIQKTNTDYPNASAFSWSTNRMASVGSNLFVASNETGVYKSDDYGDSWTRVDQGFAQWNQFSTTAVMCLYSDGTNLYASMGKDDSAYVSTDGGNNWSDISVDLNHYIKSFSNHKGQLFATQWDTDTSIVVYSGTFVSVDKKQEIAPQQFALSQNYPNPFNPTTTINYEIPLTEGVRSGFSVNLAVYNTRGQKVRTLLNQRQEAGKHQVTFHAESLASGVYFYRLKINKNLVKTRRMLLIK